MIGETSKKDLLANLKSEMDKSKNYLSEAVITAITNKDYRTAYAMVYFYSLEEERVVLKNIIDILGRLADT